MSTRGLDNPGSQHPEATFALGGASDFSLGGATIGDINSSGKLPAGHADKTLPTVLLAGDPATDSQRILDWARQWEKDNPEAAERIRKGEDPTLRIPLDILNPQKT